MRITQKTLVGPGDKMAANRSLLEFFSVKNIGYSELTDDEPDEDAKFPDTSKPPSKKYKRSFCQSWKEKFLWLEYDGERMYCTYCKEAKKNNSYTGGCLNFRITDIQKHASSRDHRMATESYAMRLSGATVTAGFHRLTTEREEAVVAAMRNVYWLAKEDIASLKYKSLNSLVKLQGYDSIQNLYVSENAKYTSPEVVREMQGVLSQCIKSDIYMMNYTKVWINA